MKLLKNGFQNLKLELKSAMCRDQACLAYFLLILIPGFAVFILFLLKLRKKSLLKNLAITSDEVLDEFTRHPHPTDVSKSDLIFGIWQDSSSSNPLLVVKNHRNETIGSVEFTVASRSPKMIVGQEVFQVEFPLTWKRSALLREVRTRAVRASYQQLSFFDQHKFGIPQYGTLTSERNGFNLRLSRSYRLNEILVGTTEEISSIRKVGRLAVFPSLLALPLRIFMLAV